MQDSTVRKHCQETTLCVIEYFRVRTVDRVCWTKHYSVANELLPSYPSFGYTFLFDLTDEDLDINSISERVYYLSLCEFTFASGACFAGDAVYMIIPGVGAV